MADVMELIRARHSVREYLDKPIEEEKKAALREYAEKVNQEFSTDVQMFFDDEDGFKNADKSYGNFAGCKNYYVLVGDDAETSGYVGELIALKAQELGLNTCFVALTYKKGNVKKKVRVNKGQKIQCTVALGYGKTQGSVRPSKTKEQILDIKGEAPETIDRVVEACLLAPTAINQQKFKITCCDGKIDVERSGFGFYADVDLGIVKAHKDLALGIRTL